jgi:hypothetical protein
MKIDGRCHCGEITFEAAADPDALHICHCAPLGFMTAFCSSKAAFKACSGNDCPVPYTAPFEDITIKCS